MNNVINTPITRNPLLKAAIVFLNVLLLARPVYYIVYGILNLLDGYSFTPADSVYMSAYLFEVAIAVIYIVLCLRNTLTPKIIGIISIVNSVISVVTLVVGQTALLEYLNPFQIFMSISRLLLGNVIFILIAVFFYMSNKRNIGWAIAGLVINSLSLLTAIGGLFSSLGTLAVETSSANTYGLMLSIFNSVISVVAVIFSVMLLIIVLKLKSTEEN